MPTQCRAFSAPSFGKHIEELLISPLPPIVILLGYIAGSMFRGIGVGIVVLIISSFFTDLHFQHPLITAAVVVLTSAVFSLAGFINAIFAQKFDDVTIVPTFVLTPLTYLGGVFYSIQMLPELWQKVSLANPILYMVNAFRYGILGVSDVPVQISFTLIFFFLFLLGGVCLFLLHRGVGLRA